MVSNIACSITDETTVTAPGDTDTPVTSGDTATPGDTAAPVGDTPATPDTPTASADPTTEPTAPVVAGGQRPADSQESAELAPFTYEYPKSLLTNRNDRSTPLGKLCWAYWEYASQQLARIHKVLVDNTPNLEVTFPAIADITEGEENSTGPVGIVNEVSDEPPLGTDGYLIGSLEEIQEPSITGIVDDPGLSEELQLFAEAFFAYIEAFEVQVRAVGYENIERSQLPYQDFEDIPYKKEFSDAFEANPDKCVIPSEDETNQFYNDLRIEMDEYLEGTGGLVTIE